MSFSSSFESRLSRERSPLSSAIERARRFGPTIALLSLLSGAQKAQPEGEERMRQSQPTAVEYTPTAIIVDQRRDHTQEGVVREVTRETLEEEGDVWLRWGNQQEPTFPEEMARVQQEIRSVVARHLSLYRENRLEPNEVIRAVRVLVTATRNPLSASPRTDETEALASAHHALEAIKTTFAQAGLEEKIETAYAFTDAGEWGLESFGQQLYPFGFSGTGTGADQRRRISSVIEAIQHRDVRRLEHLLPRLNGRFSQLETLYHEQIGSRRRVNIDIEVDLFPVQVRLDEGAPIPSAITTIAMQQPPAEQRYPVEAEPNVLAGSLLTVAGRRSQERVVPEERFDPVTEAWFRVGDAWTPSDQRGRSALTEEEWFRRGEDA